MLTFKFIKMKKFCLSAILVIFTFSVAIAQKIVKNDLYTVVYSEVYEQPLSIKYTYPNPFVFKSDTLSILRLDTFKKIVYQIPHYQPKELIKKAVFGSGHYVDGNGKKVSRKIYFDNTKKEIEYPKVSTTRIDIDTVVTKNWKTPLGINTSDDKDYDLPYHKGHLVPNASFKDNSNEDFLMSYLNCAIMHKDLNKSPWIVLENRERKISKESLLSVSVVLNFGFNNKISKGGASIPQSFTKILDYRKPNGIFAREVYCFPNDASVYKKNIESYKVKELSFERDEFEELFK